MLAALLARKGAGEYGIRHHHHDRPQSLLALAATVVLHGAVLKFGLAVFSWVSVPAQVDSLPLIVSLVSLLSDTGPGGQSDRIVESVRLGTPGSGATRVPISPVAPVIQGVSTSSPPVVERWPVDSAALRAQETLNAQAVLTGISRGSYRVGDVGSLSGLALSAAIDRRMRKILERQENYIASVDDHAGEDIVSRRARCLVIPFVFTGSARESDSTITMWDPYCEPDPLPFALDGPNEGMSLPRPP